MLERGVVVTYETIRCWCDKFDARFAQCAKAARRKPGSTWHLDEMFVTLRGEPYLLWRAVDEHVDEGGQVMCMLSEGDLLRRAEIDTGDRRLAWWLELLASTRELASAYVKVHGHTVRDVMREKVVSVEESTPLADIASLLERNRIKRVPVLRDGKLVGIISYANLVRALASIQPDKSGFVSSDREIRDAIVRVDRPGIRAECRSGARCSITAGVAASSAIRVA